VLAWATPTEGTPVWIERQVAQEPAWAWLATSWDRRYVDIDVKQLKKQAYRYRVRYVEGTVWSETVEVGGRDETGAHDP
jgi:hypothetical protein